MFLVSSCKCNVICPIHCKASFKVWRCSWSSAYRRCSNYIWVIITKFIAYYGATYTGGLTVTGNWSGTTTSLGPLLLPCKPPLAFHSSTRGPRCIYGPLLDISRDDLELPVAQELTALDQKKMVTILQTTSVNAVKWLKFHQVYCYMCNSQYVIVGSGNCMATRGRPRSIMA